MLSLSQVQLRGLTTSVGNNMRSSTDDVINTRKKFAALGRHSEDTDKPYIDEELDSSIRQFQRDKGLKQDGKVHPRGETERMVDRNLSLLQKLGKPEETPSMLISLSAPVGDGQENQSTDVTQVQQSLGGLGLVSEKKLFEPNGIIDQETLGGIRKFQSQNNLKQDAKINPAGETQTALNNLIKAQKENAAAHDLADDDEDEEEKDKPCAAERDAYKDAKAARDTAKALRNTIKKQLDTTRDTLKTLREKLQNFEINKPPKPERKPEREDCNQLSINAQNSGLAVKEAQKRANKAILEHETAVAAVAGPQQELIRVAAIAGVELALASFPWGKILTVVRTLAGVKSIAGVTVAIRDVIDAKKRLDDTAQVATNAHDEQKRLLVELQVKIDKSIEAQKLYDACINNSNGKYIL